MREILFRGKRYNGEWVKGYYFKAKQRVDRTTLCAYISVPHPKRKMIPSDDYMVDPDTVSEFTGLRDKNGKRIFEGDIVEFDVSSGKTKDTVIWDYGEYNGVTGFRLKKYALFSITETNRRYFEVIGNKWDNPELLEG